MTVLNFPATPAFNDTYTENGVTYTWNGTYWDANSGTPLDDKYVEVAGDVMTGNLLLPGGGGDTAALQKQEIELLIDAAGGGGTGPTDLYWERDAGTLSPKVSTDNVDIGDSKITLNAADGSAEFAGLVEAAGGYEAGGATLGGPVNGFVFVRNDKTTASTALGVFKNGNLTEDLTASITNDGRIAADVSVRAGTASSTSDENGAIMYAPEGGFSSYPAIYDPASLNFGSASSAFQIVSKDTTVDATRLVKAQWRTDGSIRLGNDLSDTANGNVFLYADSGDINTIGQLYSGLNNGLGLIRSNRASDEDNIALLVDGAGATRTFGVFGNGKVYVGGDFSSADPSVELTPAGKITAKQQVTVGTTGSAPGTQGAYLWAGTDSDRRSSLAFYNNVDDTKGIITVGSAPDTLTAKTVRFAVRASGRVEVGEDVASGFTTSIHLDPVEGIKVGGVMADAPNIQLNPDGTIACGGDTGATSLAIDSAAAGGTNYAITSTANGLTTFRLDSNGTVSLADSSGTNTQLYPDGKATFGDAVTVVLGRVGSPSDACLALQGTGGDFYAQRYTNHDMCVVSSSSSGNNLSWRKSDNSTLMRINDAGTLYIKDVLQSGGVTLNLEADDETKYTKTMGDTGIEHYVYNGATLNVKESIETATAARTAMRETFQELRTAVQSATDFGQLKAAMLVALEDYAV